LFLFPFLNEDDAAPISPLQAGRPLERRCSRPFARSPVPRSPPVWEAKLLFKVTSRPPRVLPPLHVGFCRSSLHPLFHLPYLILN